MVKSSANIDPLTGNIFVARGHGYIMNLATAIFGVYHQAPYDCQGFINEFGEYLDRKEAFIEATNCKQIFDDKYGNQDLYSEDIWYQIEDKFYMLPATEKTKIIAKKEIETYGRNAFVEEPGLRKSTIERITAQEYFRKYWIDNPIYTQYLFECHE